MSDQCNQEVRVVAIDPTSRGFGFAVFEGPGRLIDWGVAHVRNDKHSGCLRRIGGLVEHYAPAVLVVEDYGDRGSRRCARVRKLLQAILQLASNRKIRTQRFSRRAVREAFAGSDASTKEQIAGVIAARYPELLPYLPPPRKCWMSEDVRMSIFDAAALAQAFFHSSTIDAKARLKSSRKAA